MHPDDLEFGIATESDIAGVVALRSAVAADLTARYGHGHWSGAVTEKSQLRELRTSRIVVVRWRTSAGRANRADAAERGAPGHRETLAHRETPVAGDSASLVGTLRLATKKPWAIDVSYFTAVPRALYLLDMAVDPRHQRQGIGRILLDTARDMALAWPAQSLRLDAYDSPAGAGGFYARSGFREVGRVVYRGVPLVYFEWVA